MNKIKLGIIAAILSVSAQASIGQHVLTDSRQSYCKEFASSVGAIQHDRQKDPQEFTESYARSLMIGYNLTDLYKILMNNAIDYTFANSVKTSYKTLETDAFVVCMKE